LFSLKIEYVGRAVTPKNYWVLIHPLCLSPEYKLATITAD